MAIIDVSEYSVVAKDNNGQPLSIFPEPPLAHQKITATANPAVQSAAFSSATRIIRINTTAAVYYAVGPDPTASATSSQLSANSVTNFGVTPGHKISLLALA